MKQNFSEIVKEMKENPSDASLSNMLDYFKQESLKVYAPIMLNPSDEDFMRLVNLRRGEAYVAVHDIEFAVDTFIKEETGEKEYLCCFTDPDNIPKDFYGVILRGMYLDEFLDIVHSDSELAKLPVIIDPMLPNEIVCSEELSNYIVQIKHPDITQDEMRCHPIRYDKLETVIAEKLANFDDIVRAYIAEVGEINSRHFVIFLETVDESENRLAVKECLAAAKNLTDPLVLTISFIDEEMLKRLTLDSRPNLFYKKLLS